MNSQAIKGRLASVFLLVAVLAQGGSLPSVFTYQGRLFEGTNAVTGLYDLKFTLFDSHSAGAALSPILITNAVPVTNGLFTINLDFGPVFDGSARWLEISERTNGASAFMVLSPRQLVSVAPYATYAAAAGSFWGGTLTLTNLDSGGVQPLELFANGYRGLRLEPTDSRSAPNLIAGYGGNFVSPGVVGATIGGGGAAPLIIPRPPYTRIDLNNSVTADFAVVAGGLQNAVHAADAVVGGGQGNTVSSNGVYAVIPGGDRNVADGTASFAAGRRARALHDGSFVWADSTEADFASTGSNQFLIRATGGVGIGSQSPRTALDVAGIVTAQGFAGRGALRWETVTGQSQQAVPNTGYMVGGATRVSITLPPSPQPGDIVRVACTGLEGAGWKILPNTGQLIVVRPTLGWKTCSAPTADWLSIASSADGTKLFGGTLFKGLYISTDFGVTWTKALSAGAINGIASSANGFKIVAADMYHLYTSTDSGTTWDQRGASANWVTVASSDDGAKLVAAASGISGGLCTSTDSGVNWTQRKEPGSWTSVASSADGAKLVAGLLNGQIYTSTDSGLTWTARESTRQWRSLASSADGTKLVAAERGGRLYNSWDSGVTWTPRESAREWKAVASSADGTRVIAAVNVGMIYTSSDSGVSWTASENERAWSAVASSADGTRLAAVVRPGEVHVYTGYITTSSGPAGYLAGDIDSAVELLYGGGGFWRILSREGGVTAF